MSMPTGVSNFQHHQNATEFAISDIWRLPRIGSMGGGEDEARSSHIAVDPDGVRAHDVATRELQLARQLAVVGEEEKPLGVEVQTTLRPFPRTKRITVGRCFARETRG